MTAAHRCLAFGIGLLIALPLSAAAQTPTPAAAQTPAPAAAPAAPATPAAQTGLASGHSKWWIVAGGGFSMTRAQCSTCDERGIFTNSKGLFVDVGGRVSPRVDAGVEFMYVTARYAEDDPIRTMFVMAVGQFRPWLERGLYLRAGMGLGFVGNGIYSPFGPKLSPPYSTNGLGMSYGLGWIFRRERKVTIQAAFSQHVAALGALSTQSGETMNTINNVVGNYWTSGLAIVIR